MLSEKFGLDCRLLPYIITAGNLRVLDVSIEDKFMRCCQYFNVAVLLLDASSTRLQALGLVLILCMLLLGLAIFMSRFRDYAAEDQRDSSFNDSNFEEMLLQGDITEQEYRKIVLKRGRSLAKGDSRDAS